MTVRVLTLNVVFGCFGPKIVFQTSRLRKKRLNYLRLHS